MNVSEKKLPAYLTVGLHGVRDSIIIVTLPKYVPSDGHIDTRTLEKDGYSLVVNFEGDFEGCFIESLRKGDAMKVEIFSGNQSSEQKKEAY